VAFDAARRDDFEAAMVLEGLRPAVPRKISDSLLPPASPISTA